MLRTQLDKCKFMVLFGVLSFPFLLMWLGVRDPIPQYKWDRIYYGMTKQQLTSLLGPPDDSWNRQIAYHAFFNMGWVEITFDSDDKLIYRNDKSVLGSLRGPSDSF
jgi:hypothetical protein